MGCVEYVSKARIAFLLAYALMPDHLHLLVVPRGDATISDIMHSIKGYSAREINKHAGRKGPVWQPRFYDRAIRDEEQLSATIAYVEGNPVMAGLVQNAADFPWSSANPANKTDLADWL